MSTGQPPVLGDWIITTSESLSGGTYEVHDGDIIIRNGGSLTLDGTEIRMDDTTGPVYFVEVQSGGTLIMRNGALIRSEYNNSNYYGFFIRDGATARITDSNISDAGEMYDWPRIGVYIESDDVLIDNTDITRGGYGIVVVGASPTISNNTIYDNQATGIYSELGGPKILDNDIYNNGHSGQWWQSWPGVHVYNSDATVEGNLIDDNGWNGAAVGPGIRVALSNVSIRNNTVTDNGEQGIQVENHAFGIIADNDVRWNDDQGISVNDHSKVALINNKVYTNGDVGIYVTGHSSPLIKDNYVNTTNEYTMLINRYSQPDIQGNTVLNWGSHDAIEITDDCVVNLEDNDIFSQNNYGVDITHWVKANIVGNTIDAGSVAVDINDFSEARLVGNTLSSRWSHGLNVGYYTHVTGEYNTIDSRNEGLDMWSYSSTDLLFTDITSTNDYGASVRGWSELHLDGGSITSNNHIGVYSAMSYVDIRNATITAPNDHDIHLGTGSTSYPGLVETYNVTFNQSSTGFDDNLGRLNVFWYAEEIKVEWQNDRKVPFADVWIENVQGQVVFSDQADRNGLIQWLPVQEYTQNRTNRLDYTRHNFSAEMNGITNFAGANVNKNLKVRIILQDNVNDPLIDIINPIDMGIYNTSVVWVNGTAQDPESGIYRVTVWPDGLTELVANGTEDWGTNVTLPDGEWTMWINATNYAGVKEWDTVTITVDTVEPDLVVDFPAPIDLVNTENITVRGTTEVGAFVTVNGMNATVDASGNWNLTIQQPEGVNTVVVASRDVAMNYNISIQEVTVDLTPPPLVVFNPGGDIITATSPLVASGWVEAGCDLSVNGTAITYTGEPWSTSIALLEGVNVLEFVAVDPAGNPTTVVREVTYDTAPPLVTVDLLSDGSILAPGPNDVHLTNVVDLDITGMVMDLTYDHMTINGVNVSLDVNDTYAHDYTLTEGMNLIEVLVLDKAGHKTVVTMMVELDTIPPPLEVYTPEQDLLTNQPQVHITGYTEVGAVIWVNNHTIVVGTDGAFDHVYTLLEGSNILTITAFDLAGNPTVVVRDVDLDTVPPELKVTSPKKGTSHSEYSVEVTGKASDNIAFDKLFLNGKEVSVKNGKFSTTLALKDGANTLVVTAIDLAGNEVTEEIKVTREGLTGMQSGLLGLGVVFLIIGLLVGMVLSKSMRSKAGPKGPPPDEDEDLDEARDDDMDGDMDDDHADTDEPPDKDQEPGGKDAEDEAAPDGSETEPRGEAPGPPKDGPKTDPEPKTDKKPDGQKAEGEAPPEDADKSIVDIMEKLKK